VRLVQIEARVLVGIEEHDREELLRQEVLGVVREAVLVPVANIPGVQGEQVLGVGKSDGEVGVQYFVGMSGSNNKE
jgi:hypothetical protein